MRTKYPKYLAYEVYQDFMRTGRSQKELAKKYDITPTTVSHYIDKFLKARMKKPEEEYSAFTQMKSLTL